MVHRKIRKGRRKIEAAKDKAARKNFEVQLKKSQVVDKQKRKAKKAKRKVRSKTAPARIEAKATKHELGKLKNTVTPKDGSQRIQKAKNLSSEAAAYADAVGSSFDAALGVDRDGNGQVDTDEVAFARDLNQDGDIDRGELFAPVSPPGNDSDEGGAGVLPGFDDILIDMSPPDDNSNQKKTSQSDQFGDAPDLDDYLF